MSLLSTRPFSPQVGGEVARRAKGLGMKLIAHDPYASVEKAAAVGVELVSFDEALARGDFFSLHLPLTPGTNKLFSDGAFAKIKKVSSQCERGDQRAGQPGAGMAGLGRRRGRAW